ncbi:MAG: bifunctional UDP-N-acetylglucosamine diphosphorylase/glucosamine-1-phosphate N-acetyltransferase GlmU [Firmicutes bacterium]|nr:bifunctional UDP-N-acetylglucosamine diphosphorylase/glucosamine-1-phosphate N-acetyltransferase GlmU [Bacillota bacterium]
MSTVAVILAAGLGTRMKSTLPKVLHPVLGDASLLWVLRALPSSVSAAVLVLHHGKAQVEEALQAWEKLGLLPCPITTVDQETPLGTGHAVQQAIPELDRLSPERVVILSGDVPLLRRESIDRLTAQNAVLLAMELNDPTGYGRVLRRTDGSLQGIVEQKDASEEIRSLRLVNGGAYALPWKALRPALAGLTNANAQKEYYLTDAVAAVAAQLPVQIELCEASELMGMNSRLDQAELQRLAQKRINAHWMAQGVTLLAPERTVIGPMVVLAQDVLIEPNVRLEGRVRVGSGTRLGQGCVFRDCQIGCGAEVRPYCVGTSAAIGDGAKVGPFAHLREGTLLENDVHLGNFVETKKAHLKAGAKANHLSYLGDCEIGERTNIGAGFITCNYDGARKHRTLIGRDVFIGSDCQAVAPLAIGDGAMTAAGTTLTKDVPADALALARTPQVNREHLAARLRERR